MCGVFVLATLACIVASALPGAAGQGVGSSAPYAYVTDVREYAGTGYGGETTHSVRVDLKFSQVGSGGSTTGSSTTGSTTSTTGSTTGGTTPTPTTGPQTNASYALVPHAAVVRPGVPTPGVPGIHVPPVASDFVNPAAWTSAHADARPGTTGTTATTGSTTSTTGTTSGTTGGGGYGPTTYYLGVDSAYASTFSLNGSTASGITWTRSSGTSVTGYPVGSTSDTFQYRLPGAATRTVYVVVRRPIDGVNYETSFYPATLALTRRDVPSVAIDSRRVYGQPDLDGEVPADPNADLRNPSFKDWVYKGGLFVGNAPPGTRDQSGTARVQGYVPSATFTYPLMASYTLLALGHPGGTAFATAAPYAAFVPSSNDPNLGTTIATATWANKWDLGSATAAGADEGYGSLPLGEYSRMVVPSNAAGVGIALQSEDSAVSSGTAAWQYFANAGYALAPDPAPRVWTVDRTSNDGGWVWIGTGGYTGP